MAKATYVFDLTKAIDVEKAEELLYLFASFWNTKEFRRFIADKCLEVLARLSKDLPAYDVLEHNVFNTYVEEYKRSHLAEIGKDYVILFNGTYVPQEEMWYSGRINYPDGLNVAYIIEYGTGLLGIPAEDWDLNLNGWDARGWWYTNPDTGKGKHTIGLEAQLVYFQLMDVVKKHFQEWVEEYADKLF